MKYHLGMGVHLLTYWDRLRSSFWFLPSLMSAGAIALAFAMVALDHAKSDEWRQAVGWVYSGGAEGASSVLGTIASSMITIGGVVFSMTLIALSLASSQLGPRLLRNFMRDTATQMVLGTFVATFLYCLLVLRTIRREDESPFVPHLSVTLGVLFAVGGVGVLIYFIHHISRSIQADVAVAKVGEELMETIDRLFPESLETAAQRKPVLPREAVLPEGFDDAADAVLAASGGYLESFDMDDLMKIATEEDLVLCVDKAPGSYVFADRPLVHVWPGDRNTDAVTKRIRTAFSIGTVRTTVQDIQFPVSQLVEIAVRALSPSMNDPFTAIRCVDRLGSALSRLAKRKMPSPYRYDDENRIRVLTPTITFPVIADTAFNQIRQYGRTSAAVTIRLLEVLAEIAENLPVAEDRAALRHHAAMIARGAEDGLPEADDRRKVKQRYEEATRILDARS